MIFDGGTFFPEAIKNAWHKARMTGGYTDKSGSGDIDETAIRDKVGKYIGDVADENPDGSQDIDDGSENSESEKKAEVTQKLTELAKSFLIDNSPYFKGFSNEKGVINEAVVELVDRVLEVQSQNLEQVLQDDEDIEAIFMKRGADILKALQLPPFGELKGKVNPDSESAFVGSMLAIGLQETNLLSSEDVKGIGELVSRTRNELEAERELQFKDIAEGAADIHSYLLKMAEEFKLSQEDIDKVLAFAETNLVYPYKNLDSLAENIPVSDPVFRDIVDGVRKIIDKKVMQKLSTESPDQPNDVIISKIDIGKQILQQARESVESASV